MAQLYSLATLSTPTRHRPDLAVPEPKPNQTRTKSEPSISILPAIARRSIIDEARLSAYLSAPTLCKTNDTVGPNNPDGVRPSSRTSLM